MLSRHLSRSFVTILFLLTYTLSFAQNEGTAVKDFYVETRFGWEAESISGDLADDNTYFKGQWLNLRLDGQILPGLTYSYRQRLNKNTSATFFDATDWLHLDWKVSDKFGLSAGKQVVAIGGYEYDRAPIDLYYCSEFWNNIPCYQIGISGTYNVTDHDQLLLQLCNSPLRAWAGNNTYAVNLMWYGSHGLWETMWSVNMLQRTKDKWMNYVALGNRFIFSDAVHLDIDFMNRYASGQSILDDWSIMSELSANTSDKLRLFAKYTFDYNFSGTDMDVLVYDGTKLSMASLGAEWTANQAFKAFCVGAYGFGTNANPSGTRLNEQFLIQAGIKFRLDILAGIRNLSGRK